MKVNHTKRAMAIWVIAVAALLPRSHFADGNNANDPKPPVTNREILRLVNDLRADIIKLQATVGTAPTAGTPQTPLASKIDALDRKVVALQDVAAKRGVAVIRAIPTTARSGNHLSHPRIFILGSTIKDFHDTLAWGAELSSAGTLPDGTYLIELRQPRPPDDDAACAGRKPLPASTNLRVAGVDVPGGIESNPRCHPMRLSQLGGPTHRRLFTGSAVVKVDGTGGLSFTFKIPTAWVTTGRPVHTYAGSIMITRLE